MSRRGETSTHGFVWQMRWRVAAPFFRKRLWVTGEKKDQKLESGKGGGGEKRRRDFSLFAGQRIRGKRMRKKSRPAPFEMTGLGGGQKEGKAESTGTGGQGGTFFLCVWKREKRKEKREEREERFHRAKSARWGGGLSIQADAIIPQRARDGEECAGANAEEKVGPLRTTCADGRCCVRSGRWQRARSKASECCRAPERYWNRQLRNRD